MGSFLREGWARCREEVAALLRLGWFILSGDYQALCVQAWSGRYTPRGDPRQADCILGFAFGRLGGESKVRPGLSNEQLATIARKHFPCLPAILQWEVADAYPPGGPGPLILRIDQHRQPGRYLDTRELAEQARFLMAQRGWKRAVLLAQGHHVPRALRVCRRLGIDTVLPEGLERIAFCPGSSQPWTRSAGAWYRRECLALLHHAWKGWL
jgi:hypothetical protein